MIRMDKNESPIQPLTRTTLHHLLDQCAYHLYPDDAYEPFVKAYTNFYGNLAPDEICLGNGSDDLIQKLMLTMPEGPCLALHPDFFMYQDFARQTQREMIYVNASEDLKFSVDAIIQKIKEVEPSFFIFSNPHNPTGYRFNDTDVQRLLDAVTSYGGYLVVDEAYVEFSQPLNIKRTAHLLQMRTMSKAFAIAGLRLGMLIGTKATLDIVRQIEQPYPMSGFTLEVGRYIFEHQEATHTFIEHQRQLSARLKDIINTYASPLMTVYPSDTNFILTRGDAAMSLGKYAQSQGFMPRFYDPEKEYPMGQSVRYSIATDAELDQFEAVVKEWSEQYALSNES